jgi:hypothetical protein
MCELDERISLATAAAHTVFPAFQFDEQLNPIAALLPVWRLLRAADDDGWTAASWIQLPHAELGGMSIPRFLLTGGEPERSLTLAQGIAGRWRQ